MPEGIETFSELQMICYLLMTETLKWEFHNVESLRI